MKNHIKKSSLALAIAASLTLSACGSSNGNKAPIASDLALNSVSSNAVVTFTDADLLALSTDPDGDVLSIDTVTLTSGTGALTQSSGGWSYQPSPAEVGPIKLAYVVTDGEDTTTANVTFTLSDPSTTVVDANGIVTVSGMVIDAITRQPVVGVAVSLMANGTTHSAYSSATGAYTFKQVSEKTEFRVEVMDSSGVYAVEAFGGITDESNVADQMLSFTAEDIELYKAVATSITVKDINGGAVVEGLSLYYDLAGKSVLATESPTGVYSFALADDDNGESILAEQLISNDVWYEPFNDNNNNNNFLVELNAYEDITYYVKSDDETEFTVYLHIVDDEGHPLDVGNVLPMAGGQMQAERKAGTTNEYFFTVTADSIGNDWYVAPIDLDGDGFSDYTQDYTQYYTHVESVLGITNHLNRGSFDDNREATLVIPLTIIDYNESIQAEIISSDDNFQANGLAEVIIAFDRPIDLIHQPRMSYEVLAKKEVKRNVQDPAIIYENDFTTTVTTNQGESSSLLDADNDYVYLDKDAVSQKLALADDVGKIKSPYADDYDSETTVIDLTSAEYVMAAGNTIVKITLDATTLKSDQTYSFELSVKGQLDDNPVAIMEFHKTAKSSATATLDTITVDNFDYKQTATKDLLDATKELDIAGQTAHTSKFSQLNVGYAGGAATDFAQLEYLTYGLDGTSQITIIEPGVNHSLNVLYIVSPAALEGSVQVLSQTEKYVDNSVIVSESFSDTGMTYTLDYNGQDISDDGDLQSLTQIYPIKTYLLNVPANHGISGGYDNNALLETFASSPASGADIAAEGVHYIYALPVTTQSGQVGAFVDTVELDFNVTVNGAALTGKKTYTVK
jgi:hypothetical protein